MSDTDNMLPSKVLKKLPEGFASAADSMDEAELKKVIVQCEGNLYSIDKEKAADQMLVAAKNTSKELSGPYRDAKATLTAKITYACWVLENRGAGLDTRDDKE